MIITTADSAADYIPDIDNKFDFTEGGPIVGIDCDPVAYSSAFACDKQTHIITLGAMEVCRVQGGKTELYEEIFVKDKAELDAMLDRNPDMNYEVEVSADDPKNLFHTIKTQINKIVKQTGAGGFELYLTKGETNFRIVDGIATVLKYKGNRSSDAKPSQLGAARDYMVEQLGAIMCEGIEADDAITIKHRQAWTRAVAEAKAFFEDAGKSPTQKQLEDKAFEFCDYICATIDKDLRMSAGLHFNPNEDLGIEKVRPFGTLKLIKSDSGNKLKFNGLLGFYTQLLTGDGCDNIPSLKGYGPVTAEALLKGCKTEEQLFKAVYGAVHESFLQGHLEASMGCLREKLEVAIASGKFGNDNKSNRDKKLKMLKDNFKSTVAYGPLHYYPWDQYVQNADGTVSKELIEGAKPATITPREYLLQVARLVYMLDTEPSEDGAHLWQFPNEDWAREVEQRYAAENVLRVETPWPL